MQGWLLKVVQLLLLMVSGGGAMIRNRCFAADLLHTVSDCVISDTMCNKDYDKEVFCENITWV